MSEETGGGASRSTDPAAGTSAATDVSLREHLTQAIDYSRKECREGLKHVEEMIEAARHNSDENIAKALASIDKRFDAVNEFRSALSDLSKTMATHADVTNLADKVTASDKALEARFEGLYQRNRDDIDKITGRLNIREGQTAGSRITGGILVTVITVAIAAIGLIVVLANVLTSP